MSKKREQIKIFFIEKKWWTATVCLCLAAAMFYVVNFPAAVGASTTTRQLPIYCVQRDQKLVAISFDAAWGEVILRQTDTILFSIIYHNIEVPKVTQTLGTLVYFEGTMIVWILQNPAKFLM